MTLLSFGIILNCGGGSLPACKIIEGTVNKPILQECEENKQVFEVYWYYDDEGNLVQKEKYFKATSSLVEVEWYIDGKLYSKRYYDGEDITNKIEYYDPTTGGVKETIDLELKEAK